MYVDIVPNRNSPPAVLLREYYRKEGRVLRRTLANLSGWSKDRIEALRTVLRGDPLPLADAQQVSRAELEQGIRQRFQGLEKHLDERARRLLAAAEAEAFGHGGITAAARATGLSRTTITKGIRDLAKPMDNGPCSERIRRPGGGRKKKSASLDERAV
jgi:DNA-binding phage protein